MMGGEGLTSMNRCWRCAPRAAWLASSCSSASSPQQAASSYSGGSMQQQSSCKAEKIRWVLLGSYVPVVVAVRVQLYS
eukprot:COSAG01_NODE_40040_length_468_cov_1.403794_1_plen_78_part_00